MFKTTYTDLLHVFHKIIKLDNIFRFIFRSFTTVYMTDKTIFARNIFYYYDFNKYIIIWRWTFQEIRFENFTETRSI